MNRNNPQSLAMRARDSVKSLRTRDAATDTVVLASMYSTAAFAQATDVGGAITAEVTGAKTTVNGILMILAGIVGALLLWAYVKRAK